MSRRIDVAIVGAQKAGTSSLRSYLAQHPRIASHRGEIGHFVFDDEYRAGWDAALRRYYPDARPGALLLAKNVGLSFSPHVLDRLREHNPYAHVVLLLRHPAERAWSAYHYCRRRGIEPVDGFEAALEAERAREAEGRPLTIDELSRGYLRLGRYADPVDWLRERFDPARVHVVLTEELHAAPAHVCARLVRSFGLEPFTPDVSRRHNGAARARSLVLARLIQRQSPLRARVRRLLPAGWGPALRERLWRINEAGGRLPAPDPALRAGLIEHFRPHNARLESLIGKRLDAWNR